MNSRQLGSKLGLVGAILAATLIFAGQAGAATSTIGQLASDTYTTEPGPPPYYYPIYTYHPPTAPAPCTTAQDYLQAGVGSGTSYVVPANGEKITAWRTKATTGSEQQMTLKVFRQVGATSEYEVVAHDGPHNLNPAASSNVMGPVNAFTGLSIPVQPGDLIGLFANSGTTACMFAAAGTYMSSGANLADSASGPFTSNSGYRLNLTADVLLKSTGGPAQHTLTATVTGTGAGAVQSSPAGIEACTSTCSQAFDEGTMVTLTASPDGYSTFAGWSGGGCTGTGSCQVAVNADTSVTATFNTAAAGYGSYEYPAYGPPPGENGGGNPQPATHSKCRKPKPSTHGARKPRCGKKTRVVAKRAHNAGLGAEILTAKNGHTLYSLSAEGGGTFICTAGCLSIWHPLTIPAGIRPLGPVKLGTVKRPEGSTQVTYHGKPVYTFTEDASPGDAHGQGIKDVGTWGAVVIPPPHH